MTLQNQLLCNQDNVYKNMIDVISVLNVTHFLLVVQLLKVIYKSRC